MATALSIEETRRRYDEAKSLDLALDMTRGKPCSEQLDLSLPLLDGLSRQDHRSLDGTDCRNYGGIDGLAEARRLFASILAVSPDQVLLGDNASLNLMYDVLAHALLRGLPSSPRPWREEKVVKILCPCPGYDRHFAMCEFLGLEMIPVELGPDGPDLVTVSRHAEDPAVKGIFCVPRYSNPTGVTYSDETVRSLAGLEAAAPDFVICWDNAYAVHHLYSDPQPLLEILSAAAAAGHPHRPIVFASTSKMTFPGAGISAVAASAKNVQWVRGFRSRKTIGPDKINELRHARFLPDLETVESHMRRHAEILRPKFEAVDAILERELGGTDLATWSRPRGGYFISLDTPPGCAKEVVAMAGEAGVRLTPAGSTFPYGKDPHDRNIRIAPTFPPLEELRLATEILALSVLLVAAGKGMV